MLSLQLRPVTATWDDHDFGANNQGKDYQCRKQSQDEFVYFYNLPSTDPRHPDQGSNQRKGVYSSNLFSKPNGDNGIHMINLDARYHRSSVYSSNCEGKDSTILGAEQWSWLEAELQVTSDIKVIASGIQVLVPTYLPPVIGPGIYGYCAYDGSGGTFDEARESVGEGSDKWRGLTYECWGEIPQERARLLQLCQKAINDGHAKKIIFLSGDQHWGEIMAKQMPASNVYGAPQVLYEVTASGIDQSWDEANYNSNRIRSRSADYLGDGFHNRECNFPFIYGGVTYNDCTKAGGESRPWCSIETDQNNYHVTGKWGYW
jgi:alkaline phosphatase D